LSMTAKEEAVGSNLGEAGDDIAHFKVRFKVKKPQQIIRS
jgi:hypothetical protein